MARVIGVTAQAAQRFEPADAGQLDVHQDQCRPALGSEPQTELAILRLHRLIAHHLEGVAQQLAAVVVVFDDQYQFVCHGCSANVKVNVDPLPGSLSTQIRPPCISAMRLASARPSPVPSRFAPSSLCTCWKAWNSSC